QAALDDRELAGPFDFMAQQLPEVGRLRTERLALVEASGPQERSGEPPEAAGLPGKIGEEPFVSRRRAFEQQRLNGCAERRNGSPELVGGRGQECPAAGIGLPRRPQRL